MSYERGFEDACELILRVLNEAKNLKEARCKIALMLAAAKERKHEEIKKELGIFNFLGE